MSPTTDVPISPTLEFTQKPIQVDMNQYGDEMDNSEMLASKDLEEDFEAKIHKVYSS